MNASPQQETMRVWLQEAGWDFQEVPDPTALEEFLAEQSKGQTQSMPAVDVVEGRRVNGVLWFRVRVFMGSACDRVLKGLDVVLAEGWLPAHAHDGQPTISFETYCD